MSEAIVVAAHPDDEVLGASTILASRSCTVVFATDGVPPDVVAAGANRRGTSEKPEREGDGEERDLADGRVAEAEEAHATLGARVESYQRLGFGDQRVTDEVVQLAEALARRIDAHRGDVFVPAYQRGHPDHDAVYVAAQLARAQLAGAERGGGDVTPQRWFAYALYGLDDNGRERFGWLDPGYFPGATSHGTTAGELERKAVALRKFESQLPDESVLAGWLADPVPESYAALPDLTHATATTRLPALRCFYEEVFEFSQFGIDPDRITTTLQAALDRVRMV